MGSAGLAAWIAQIAFWTLVLVGVLSGALTKLRAGVFVALWLIAPFVLPLVPYGAGLFTSVVAVLDIILVFMILGEDIRLT